MSWLDKFRTDQCYSMGRHTPLMSYSSYELTPADTGRLCYLDHHGFAARSGAIVLGTIVAVEPPIEEKVQGTYPFGMVKPEMQPPSKITVEIDGGYMASSSGLDANIEPFLTAQLPWHDRLSTGCQLSFHAISFTRFEPNSDHATYPITMHLMHFRHESVNCSLGRYPQTRYSAKDKILGSISCHSSGLHVIYADKRLHALQLPDAHKLAYMTLGWDIIESNRTRPQEIGHILNDPFWQTQVDLLQAAEVHES